jgi:thermostable 8-oxoguanine DNA glycosylase
MNKLNGPSTDWITELNEAENGYKFQEELTEKLDKHIGDFTKMTMLEIALWKTNRYPSITEELLADINQLRKNYNEEKAKNLLLNLLNQKGFDLPMASTVLRFALPKKFQIIDQRVYRLITDGEDQLKMPFNKEKKVELYFEYLKRLRAVCDSYNISFSKSDRILYQLDKKINKNFPIKY